MSKDLMGYDKLVEDALRGAMVAALRRAAEQGLPGDHHFYISFRTDDPGVDIGARLKATHPEEMTIVLQHQYWDLEVGDQGFSVALSFNQMRQTLTVPYAAVTAFADPSVKFGLQFHGGAEAGEIASRIDLAEPPAPAEAADAPASRLSADVVALDTFRKK
jgi:hypothetical protein